VACQPAHNDWHRPLSAQLSVTTLRRLANGRPAARTFPVVLPPICNKKSMASTFLKL
jgi:hypothetical protein